MKIVNLKEFRSMPANTLYSEYEPCIIDGLKIKMDTMNCDFLLQEMVGNIDCDTHAQMFDLMHGGEFDLDFDCTERDGYFDKSQMFAVYEKKDLVGLIDRLQKCLQKEKNNENN